MFDSRDPISDPDVSTPVHRPVDRHLLLSRAHRIATDHAGGYREGLTRSDALAELADLAAGPDVLAEAAARHALADTWYAIIAVDLLLEAGAPQPLVDRHLDTGMSPDEPPEPSTED
ncbi:hypothetical protein [Plantactinospora sonchi]|uniref:Uncharacterized protein n=1 Tax=Plantactinospora sonchi TaxID=1544735 RepID=A0ABU7S583_9ACTN